MFAATPFCIYYTRHRKENQQMPGGNRKEARHVFFGHSVHAYAETAWLCNQNGIDGIESHVLHEGYKGFNCDKET